MFELRGPEKCRWADKNSFRNLDIRNRYSQNASGVKLIETSVQNQILERLELSLKTYLLPHQGRLVLHL